MVALTIIVCRVYLAYDFGQPLSGSVPLNGSDVFVFLLTISTLSKNWTLMSDYRKNVVERIEIAAKQRWVLFGLAIALPLATLLFISETQA